MRWCEIRRPKAYFPFSHKPGVELPLPGTTCTVLAFPTRLHILDEKKSMIKEHLFPKERCPEGFTAVLDLERGAVSVFTRSCRVHVLSNLDVVESRRPPLSDAPKEQLFLGSLKQQKWEAVFERCDPKEILPLWHKLGIFLHLPEIMLKPVGLMGLLFELKRVCQAKEHAKLIEPLMHLYKVGFSETLIPKEKDTLYQGIIDDETPLPFSPYYLLTEGAKQIRSLFFIEDSGKFCFLPHLPPECFSGSFHFIETAFGQLHFKWSKKHLFQITLYAKKNGGLSFKLPASIKQCRLRTHAKDRGVIVNSMENFEIKKDVEYVWDRFEK